MRYIIRNKEDVWIDHDTSQQQFGLETSQGYIIHAISYDVAEITLEAIHKHIEKHGYLIIEY